MISISPGHWHVGTGAVGFIDEVTEARRVVEEVVAALSVKGIRVHKIIDNESKNQRENLRFLVEHHNRTNRTIDVSIHFNAASKSTNLPLGVEVLYGDDSLAKVAQKMSTAISDAGKLNNRGAKKRNDLYFLNNSKAGAIMIETCFVNSSADVALYKKYFPEICCAIMQVLLSVVEVNEALTFSSTSLHQRVQNVYANMSLKSTLVEKAIAGKIIQQQWLDKLNQHDLTLLDLCGIALLYFEKENN